MTHKFAATPVLFLIALTLFIAPRAVHLSADPPDSISPHSGGEYGDPGNYAFNARNKVLFGQWRIDDFNVMALSIVPHYVTYASFLVFGTGMWQMNLVPLIFSVLIFAVLFILAGRFFPDSGHILLFLLLANYPFIIYGRIANRIMPMTLFVVLAVLFYLIAWTEPKFFFLTTLSLSFAFLSKGKIIYFLLLAFPLSFFLILLQRGELLDFRRNLKRGLYLAAGALCVAVPWYAFLYAPHKGFFQAFGSLNVDAMIPGSFPAVLTNWFLRPSFTFFPTNVTLAVILSLYAFVLLLRLFDDAARKNISAAETVFLSWLIVGWLSNSVIGYRPIRHYIELTVPILVLTAMFAAGLAGGYHLRIRAGKWGRRLLFPLLTILAWVGLSSFVKHVFPMPVILRNPLKPFFVSLLASLALSLIVYLILARRFMGRSLSIPRKPAVLFLVLLALIYGFQNLKAYGSWAGHPTYNLKMISRDLGQAFPDAVICGLLAPAISLENRNKAHTSWTNFANDDPDFLKREGVTHLLLGTYNHEPDYYARTFPEEWRTAGLLARYRIWRSWFLLFELSPETGPPPDGPGVEAEVMQRDHGLPLFDREASGNFSVRITSPEPVLIGKETIALSGPRRRTGRLYARVETARRDAPLAAVSLRFRGREISQALIRLGSEDHDDRQGYAAYPFRIFVPEDGDYEIRIVSSGNHEFRFDRIEWQPRP